MCLNCVSTFCVSLVSESNFVDIHSCCSMTRSEKFIEHDPAYSRLYFANVYCKLSAIAAFDVNSENFEIIALWNASHWVYSYELIEVNGKLGVINYGMVNRYYNLWILKKTPEREWQRHIIRLPSICNDIVPGPISSCTSRDGKIVFSINLKSCVL
ncbi:hypothetical protein H5410_001608 [Solanum commersonii]|uniref:F-box associated beta-propeller type 3 domain-containing protein n=1 Tax=Solanum commersonii TaxID=4109 RepID=A0A9J6B046_SOLCO|nr:hypothetical protein H5410_001608 [Solanum commersonii]